MTKRLPRRMRNPRPKHTRRGSYGSGAIDTSGATVRKRFRGPTVAVAIHRLVQRMVIAGHRTPGTRVIFGEAESDPYVRGCQDLTSRLMACRRIAVPAAVYFRRHAPGRCWLLKGTEMSVGGHRCDVVWALPDGRVLIDEIKTERVTLVARRRLTEQIDAYLAAGAAQWQDRFAGVRLCVLMDPDLSVWVQPDGIHHPIGELHE
jgi:hypothetical protein